MTSNAMLAEEPTMLRVIAVNHLCWIALTFLAGRQYSDYEISRCDPSGHDHAVRALVLFSLMSAH